MASTPDLFHSSPPPAPTSRANGSRKAAKATSPGNGYSAKDIEVLEATGGRLAFAVAQALKGGQDAEAEVASQLTAWIERPRPSRCPSFPHRLAGHEEPLDKP